MQNWCRFIQNHFLAQVNFTNAKKKEKEEKKAKGYFHATYFCPLCFFIILQVMHLRNSIDISGMVKYSIDYITWNYNTCFSFQFLFFKMRFIHQEKCQLDSAIIRKYHKGNNLANFNLEQKGTSTKRERWRGKRSSCNFTYFCRCVWDYYQMWYCRH